MLKFMTMMVLILTTLTVRSFSDEVFYGVKIVGGESFCSTVWDALALVKDTSPSYSMSGQFGWWTLVKRGGLKKIQGYTEENYLEYFTDDEYSGIPGGFVKGGEKTIYLLQADWTVSQYAEMIVHEAVHVLADNVRRNDRKSYKKIFGDSDGEEVVAEKYVKEFQEQLTMDDLQRRIQSYRYGN